MSSPFWGQSPHTRLWDGALLGLGGGTLARVQEELRQVRWQDQAYTEEHHYGFTLEGSNALDSIMAGGDMVDNRVAGGGIATSTFIFPLGPQAIQISAEFRKSVTPTVGGVYVEEGGIAWKEITIQGNFGLHPKYGYDTTANTGTNFRTAAPWKAAMSGPMWTRRLFELYFDRYARMKSHQDENADAKLTFHNFKDNQHYHVVPVKYEVSRTLNDRMMYPFTIVLWAVADAPPVPVVSKPLTFLGALSTIKNAARAVRSFVSLGTSTVNALTEAVGELRSFVATIDSIIDEATRCIEACNNFRTALKQIPELGQTIVASKRANAEAAARLLDKGGVREDLRQSFYGLIDLYDTLASKAELQQSATQDQRVEQARNSSTTLNGQSDPGEAYTQGRGQGGRSYQDWTGWEPYIVRFGDTLESIAVAKLGTADQWYEIAVMNGLQAPYTSLNGLPKTAKIGDTIMIPSSRIGTSAKTGMATALDSATPADLYGTDLKLRETGSSRPGRPRVDLTIDPKTGKDVATIEGIPNLVQACQMRLWVERGTLLIDPNFGLPSVIGFPSTQTTAQVVKHAIEGGITADSRIASVQEMTITAEADMLDVEVTVIPVGGSTPETLGVVVL